MKCIICKAETKNPKFCSGSCRTKDYYQRNKEELKKKKRAHYFFLKETQHEKLREQNSKATQKYKAKNIIAVREYNRKYQRKTKRSLLRHDLVYFGGNRKIALDRDNNMCTSCFSKQKLVVHHIDDSGHSDNINNNLDNLITLCRRCHINIHRK